MSDTGLTRFREPSLRVTVEREIAAYLLGRAELYERGSPCWAALVAAADAVMDGESHAAAIHDELGDLYERIDGMRERKNR